MLLKRKISVSDLELGMHVVELDRPWTDLPFLMQHIELAEESEIDLLQAACKYVFIETDKAEVANAKVGSGSTKADVEISGRVGALNYKVQQKDSSKKASKSKPYQIKALRGLPTQASLQQELPRAQSVYTSAKRHIEELFIDSRLNLQIDVKKTSAVVSQCMSSIRSNANALFWMSRIQDVSQKDANHSLRVAILSLSLGYFIGMSEQELETLGTAALLHDLGKTRLPPEIINKTAPLSDAEKRVMEKHPALGFELLNADPNLSPVIKDVALNHHIKVDGSGFPEQQHNNELSIYTRIVSVVDAYDNMTRQHKPMSPRLALKNLYQEKGVHFDERLTKAFIKMLGIYPPGSLVEMNAGEIAIVVAGDPAHKLTPKIELIYNADGTMCKPSIIDLKLRPRRKNGELYKIRQTLPDSALGMNMREYIEQKLQFHSA